MDGLFTLDRTTGLFFAGLAALAGVLFLEWVLARMESRIPGLVLPVLTVLASLGLSVFVGGEAEAATTADAVVAGLQTFLLANVLTLMEWSIYKKGRQGRN